VFVTIKSLRFSILIGAIANLIVIANGIIFYQSTFTSPGAQIDICSGTGEELLNLPAVAVALLAGLPAGLWGVWKMASTKQWSTMAALLAIVLNLLPHSLWQEIDHHILTTRASAFVTASDCND